MIMIFPKYIRYTAWSATVTANGGLCGRRRNCVGGEGTQGNHSGLSNSGQRVENKIRKGRNDNHSSTTISMNMEGEGRGLLQSNPTILTSASRHWETPRYASSSTSINCDQDLYLAPPRYGHSDKSVLTNTVQFLIRRNQKKVKALLHPDFVHSSSW